MLNSTYKVVPFADISPESWDSLVASSPDGFAWSTSAWHDVIMGVGAWGFEDFSFGLYEGGLLVGVLPLQYSPQAQVMSSSGWGASGPVAIAGVTPKKRKDVIAALLEHAEGLAHSRGAHSLSFAVLPVTRTSIAASWGVNPWIVYGFNDLSGVSRVIDLSHEEQFLWQSLAKTSKQAIKKAQAAGLTVHWCDWLEELDNYYNLHIATYERTGVTPHPKAYFEGIAQHCAPAGYSRLWVCRDAHGEPLAYHNTALLGEGATFHTGCSNPEALENGANYLLFWGALLGAKRTGVRWYECGEIFYDAKVDNWGQNKRFGLTVFKTKFGGNDHRTFRCQKTWHEVTQLEEIAPPLSVKRHLKDCLRLAKRRVEACVGKQTTECLATALWRGYRLVKSVYSRLKSPPEIQFIKPFWGKEEIVSLASIAKYRKARSNIAKVFSSQWHLSADSQIVLTSSGRGALECALRALAETFPQKKKVILPSYACRGVYDPIIKCGLTPVFVDCDQDLLPDSDVIKKCLDSNVLACIFTYTCGALPEITSLRCAVQEAGVAWIADYCQAYSPDLHILDDDFAIFSFGIGKNISATAGGLVFSCNYAKCLKNIKSGMKYEKNGIATIRLISILLKYFFPGARIVGERIGSIYNGNQYILQQISLVDALLLHAQTQKSPEIIEKRTQSTQIFLDYIDKDKALVQDVSNHTHTKFTCIMKTERYRDVFFSRFSTSRIQLEGMYTALHVRFNAQCESQGPTNLSEVFSGMVYNIPVRPNLRPREIERIKHVLKSLQLAGDS